MVLRRNKTKSLYDEFEAMSKYAAKGMERVPRNEREMAQQSQHAVGRSIIFSIWFVVRMSGLILKNLWRLVKMVFGRGKKKDADPAFLSPLMEHQMRLMVAQQLGQLTGQPTVGQQQVVGQPQMGYPQPMQVQPIQRGGAGMQPDPLFEQLMQSFISLCEKFKECDKRLAGIENAINDVYDRLNLLQGVQPSGDKRIKFDKKR
jgi:hypothetical protein